MAQVLAFPGTRSAPAQQVTEAAQEKPPASGNVRQESHTAEQPVKPIAPKPPVYVRVRADVFESCISALGFYANQGWDQGKKARQVLEDTFEPERA